MTATRAAAEPPVSVETSTSLSATAPPDRCQPSVRRDEPAGVERVGDRGLRHPVSRRRRLSDRSGHRNKSTPQSLEFTIVARLNDSADRRRWSALALIVTAQFMVVLDVAIVNVALPSIESDLHFSQA